MIFKTDAWDAISLLKIERSKDAATINLHSIHMLLIMSKKTKSIKNQDDYEESSFKDIVKDMENTKSRALKQVPKIRKEQVPTGEETSNKILYGNDEGS